MRERLGRHKWLWAVALALVALFIFAACEEEEEAPTPTPTATPTATPAVTKPPAGAGGAAISIAMIPPLRFDQSELTIAANQDVTVEADNRDTGNFHNFAVYTDSSAKNSLGATVICTAPCKKSVTLNLAAGEYFFRCDTHPENMMGKLTVR